MADKMMTKSQEFMSNLRCRSDEVRELYGSDDLISLMIRLLDEMIGFAHFSWMRWLIKRSTASLRAAVCDKGLPWSSLMLD